MKLEANTRYLEVKGMEVRADGTSYKAGILVRKETFLAEGLSVRQTDGYGVEV